MHALVFALGIKGHKKQLLIQSRQWAQWIRDGCDYIDGVIDFLQELEDETERIEAKWTEDSFKEYLVETAAEIKSLFKPCPPFSQLVREITPEYLEMLIPD